MRLQAFTRYRITHKDRFPITRDAEVRRRQLFLIEQASNQSAGQTLTFVHLSYNITIPSSSHRLVGNMKWSTALSALPILFQGIAAMPHAARGSSPSPVKIQPGPGLPSLESLNLTVEDLLRRDFSGADNPTSLDRRQARQGCGSLFDTPTNTGLSDDALACINYLLALDTQDCAASPAERSIFCTSGNTVIQGVSQTGKTTQSWCKHVAEGARWIYNNCHAWDGNRNHVSGNAPAFGNGNMMVALYGIGSI